MAKLVLRNNTVSVYVVAMSTYAERLDEHLKAPGNSEAALALKVGCKQATINRYRNAARFPDAEQARKIDAASGGSVPFSLWQTEFMTRAGIEPTQPSERAA